MRCWTASGKGFISRQYQNIESKRNHTLRLYSCRQRSDLCISVVFGSRNRKEIMAEPNSSYFSSKLTFIRSLLRDFCSGIVRWEHYITRLHQLIRQPICWGIYRARHWRTYTRLTWSCVKLISHKRSTVSYEMCRAKNMHKTLWNTEEHSRSHMHRTQVNCLHISNIIHHPQLQSWHIHFSLPLSLLA